MEDLKQKIILFGDDPTGHTGFGKVIDHLVDVCLEMNLEPIVIGLKSGSGEQYKARLVNKHQEDSKGWHVLEDVLIETNANLLITVGDPWDLHGIVELKKKYNFLWIGYTPVEATPYPRWILLSNLPTSYLDVAILIKHTDYLVSYTDFGKDALQKLIDSYNESKMAKIDPIKISIERIYHPVELDFFIPSNKLLAKAALKHPLIKPNTILFTSLKTNTYRSGFDTLFDAWDIYLNKVEKNNPELYERSVLYLHTNLKGVGYPLLAMLQDRGYLKNGKVLIDPKIKLGQGYPKEYVHNVYNATDIFVSTSRGEGFGLNVAEAMSCATPCIIPDHGGPGEFAQDGAIKIPISATYQPEFSTTQFTIVNTKELAKQMHLLAKNEIKREQLGQRGRKVIEAFTKERFTNAWKIIINKAIEDSNILAKQRIRWEYV